VSLRTLAKTRVAVLPVDEGITISTEVRGLAGNLRGDLLGGPLKAVDEVVLERIAKFGFFQESITGSVTIAEWQRS